MTFRFLFLLCLLLSVAACQVHETREEPSEPGEPEPVVEPEDPVDEAGPLSLAIEDLQDGEVDRAEYRLDAYLADHPDSQLAHRLLEQIRHPPEVLLGEEFREIVVEPGDTLSQLAALHAGDGLLFFALARLNDITRPRLLRPGSVLRVPATEEDVTDVEESAVEMATELLEDGDAKGAFALLSSVARDDGLDGSGVKILKEAAISLSDSHLQAGRLEEAEAVLVRVEPWRVDEDESLTRQHDRLAARRKLRQAESAAADGDRRAEFELLVSALELDSGLQRAEQALGAARSALVEQYHDHALKAWRDQDVESAIVYWERVLEIDAGFEPAQVYLERAREILRRLDEL